MACNSSYNNNSSCPDKFGCVAGACADFILKRHDTQPPFKVNVSDCDGPLDLTNLVLEASMWAKARLKAAVAETDTYFALADAIGFEQIMVGDVIIMSQARNPEYMLVEGFDEVNKLVQVQRGYHATPISTWKKGAHLKIMKFMGATAETQMVYQDLLQIDGTTSSNQLTNSFLVYNWSPNDTCLPGCYYLEFKLLSVVIPTSMAGFAADYTQNCVPSSISFIPSFTDPNLTPVDFGCILGTGIESARRFPVNSEGYLIQIIDTPTKEL